MDAGRPHRTRRAWLKKNMRRLVPLHKAYSALPDRWAKPEHRRLLSQSWVDGMTTHTAIRQSAGVTLTASGWDEIRIGR